VSNLFLRERCAHVSTDDIRGHEAALMLSTDLARDATIPMGPDGVLLCGACLREKGVRIGRICTACEHAAESCRCI
jgi:hypothetical protein